MSAPWPFEPSVDPQAFAALDYAVASEGIARTQRENREGWWAHARKNRAFILDAAARVAAPRLAVVLGAGKAYDLPLPELAKRFERVILIDIDAVALAAASAAVVTDAALRSRLELRAMDLTGVTARLAGGIDDALKNVDPLKGIEDLCLSYRLAAPPRWLGERADLIVSSMVLSQLAVQPKLAAKRGYEKRFGAITRELEPRWAVWDVIETRLQQDHVEALCEHADLAVLTTDVVHHSAGESWTVIGSNQLQARIPESLEIVARASWIWERIRPGPAGQAAVRTEVDGVVLERRGQELVVANP